MVALRFKFCIFILCIVMFAVIYCLCKFWYSNHKIDDQKAISQKIIIEETEEKSKIITQTGDFKINEPIEVDKSSELIINPSKFVNLGEFKLTAYCSCSLCCGKWAYNRPNGVVYGAIGEELKEGYSITVDPKVISYRTEVVINGHTYKAQDCGGGIKGNEIDIYFDNHDDALEFGVQYAEVFKKVY